MLLGKTFDVLKISGFGLAKPDPTTTEENTCFMRPNVYMAPEVIDGQGVNSAADVYSLGISTWEMFHRKKPFYEQDSSCLFDLCNMIITGTRPKIELRMEEDMKNLILRSLEAQYKLRPRASDFATIAAKLGSETNVSSDASKAHEASLVENKSSLMTNINNASQYLEKRLTPPSRSLSSEIPNFFDSELTLLIGGYRDKYRPQETILAFEHNTKTWKKLDVEIDDLVSGAVVLDEELYAFRGNKMDAGFFKLNPDNRSWTKLAHIPNGRNPMIFESVAYRSKIYVVERYGICQTVFAYDPVANSWSKLAPIRGTMIIKGITVFNNKLYIFGRGRNSLMEVGYHDTAENDWTYSSLDFPVHFTPAVTYQNELVFFVNPNVCASSLVERTSLKTLPGLKSWRYSAAVFTCGNSLFVAGGHKRLGDNYQYSDEVESFDGMTWTEMPRMPYGLMGSTTVTATGDLAKQLLMFAF